MAIKHIYFIRHGQTEKNIKRVHQHYDNPLSKIGKDQSVIMSKFIKKFGFDTLITSPFVRARQTARIISEATGLPYTIDVSVHETVRPLYLYGKSHFSFYTLRYIVNLFLHRIDYYWDDDGAENMFTVRNRIHDVKNMITQTKEKTIAIVSHAFFISLFVHIVCLEKRMSVFKFVHMLIFVKKMPNTGIVYMQYNSEAPKGICQWQYIELITPEQFVNKESQNHSKK